MDIEYYVPPLSEFLQLAWDFLITTNIKIYGTSHFVSLGELFLVLCLSFVLLYFLFNFFTD